ncbi:hypothetical protein [uncultured Victivallis sp.]|uniref:hypothetical protein n=1 Tax=uncultured Victivallis sp. TaxID=354118 RepID=UPI0025DDB81B|nr:hypothetical protein [uncultured Victivallis sp.]
MNNGFRFSAVALAFSLGALPFGAVAEEPPPPPSQEQPQPPRPLPPHHREMMHRGPHRGPAAPLPPNQRDMMHRGPHRGAMMPLPPMDEVDRAKFAELHEVIRDAMEDFRQDGSEANRVKLRAAIDAMVDARLKYDVEQAEKKLEFVKDRLEKKAVLTERCLKRMTVAPRPEFDRPGKPGPRPAMDRPGNGCPALRPDAVCPGMPGPCPLMNRPGKDCLVPRPDAVCPGMPGPKAAPAAALREEAGKRAPREAGMRQARPERKGFRRVMERCFIEPERSELAKAHQMLRQAEAGSAEAKAAVTEMNAVFKRALERVDNELAKAKEAKQEKETAELEQAKKMLTRMAERTADPEKYLEAMKNRPAPRKRAEKK